MSQNTDDERDRSQGTGGGPSRRFSQDRNPARDGATGRDGQGSARDPAGSGGSGRGGYQSRDDRGGAGRSGSGGSRGSGGGSGRGGYQSRDDRGASRSGSGRGSSGSRGGSGRGGYQSRDDRGGGRSGSGGSSGSRGGSGGGYQSRDDRAGGSGRGGRSSSAGSGRGYQSRDGRGGSGAYQPRDSRPRTPAAPAGPAIDADITGKELDRSIREELRTLSRDAAETVSRHLVMSARLLDEDPAAAWGHAKAAVARGGRLAVVREAAGVSAYYAGEYADALAQLRAARRIGGSDSYWPMMADCERGLGRPERALAMAGAEEADRLDREGRVEMRIVASGARRDLGQPEAAVVTLQCPELRSDERASWSARLKFAYADALAAAGRHDEARDWFEQSQRVDVHDETDAAERLAELEGLVWTDTAEEPDEQDEPAPAREDDQPARSGPPER
jgi:hypothetical protein